MAQLSTVEAYMAQVPPERAALLERVRGVARRVLPDHEERIHWGMPAYIRDGKVRFGFADRKQFLSLYFVDEAVLARHAEAVAGLNRGKACLRFRRSATIDWGLVERLVAATRDERASAR